MRWVIITAVTIATLFVMDLRTPRNEAHLHPDAYDHGLEITCHGRDEVISFIGHDGNRYANVFKGGCAHAGRAPYS